MEGGGRIFWDERENRSEIGPRWALQSVLEGGNENSLGQIPRETSDYWTSNRTVRHTLTHKREERWIFWRMRGVASDIIGLLMNLSETAISLHRTGRSISLRPRKNELERVSSPVDVDKRNYRWPVTLKRKSYCCN